MKTNSYHAGYEAVVEDIKTMGFIAARDKFNMDNPRDMKPSSMDAFHYANGGLQALLDNKPA